MKTKILLIVLLVGVVCLVVYGRRTPPTYDQEDARQKQLFEQSQLLRQQRLEHYAEIRQQKLEREAEKRRRKKEDNYSHRLELLEAKVANLEYALTTKLSHTGIPPSLQDIFDVETIKQSNKGKAEIQRAVRSRILKTVKSLSDKKETK